MVVLNDWNRWATIRWHLLAAAEFLQPPLLVELERQLGASTIPSVAPLGDLSQMERVPHGDEQLISILLRLESLGVEQKPRPKMWKYLRLTAELLGQAEVRDRIDVAFAQSTKR